MRKIRDLMNSKYNAYDEPGTNNSLIGKCTFCRVVSNSSSDKILYEVRITSNKDKGWFCSNFWR